MEIEQFLYDLNDSGEAIVAYKMTSTSGASVLLCNMGAAVLSLSLRGADGELRDVASGHCTKGLAEEREPFEERLWESRVEVNRVVMSLSYEYNRVGIMAEVIFDFDDDDTFEITYQACLEGDDRFDLSHKLLFDLGGEISTEINSVAQPHETIYSIDGAKAGILSQVATLRATLYNIELLTSHQSLRYIASPMSLEPLESPAAVVESQRRYIQKSVIRRLV